MLFRTIDISRGETSIAPVFPESGEGVTNEYIVGSKEAIERQLKGIGKATAMTAGAIAFYPEDEFEQEDLRLLASRMERYLFPNKVRGEDYSILWGVYTKGGSSELRFVLPLVNPKTKKTITAPVKLLSEIAVWVKIQNQSFGWKTPQTPARAGVRPEFAYTRTNGALKPAIVGFVEEAVLAGDLNSRDDVIKDLSANGFEVKRADPRGLTVRYCGSDAEIHKKDIRLESVIFDEDFGHVAGAPSGRVREEIEAVIKGGIASIEKAAQEATGAIDGIVMQAVENRVGGAVGDYEDNIRTTITAVAQTAKEELLKAVEAGVEAHAPAVSEATAKVAALHQRIDADNSRIEEVVSAAESARKPFLIGAGVLGGLVACAALVTLWSGIKNARVSGQIASVIERAEQLDEVVLNRVEINDAALDGHLARISANDDALEAAQAGMRSLLDNINDVRNAFAMEVKSDGTEVLTLYLRRLPSARQCDDDPTCVVRVNPSTR